MAEILEIEELVRCAGNHEGRPIHWFLKDKTLSCQERLLCDICANQRGALAAWNYQNMKQTILERQNRLSQGFINRAQATREKILSFTDQIDQIKNLIITGFNSIVSKTEIWFTDIDRLERQINQFNLLEKFDETNSFEEENMMNIQKLQQCNQSYFDKLATELNNLGIQDIMEKCYRNFYNLFQFEDFRVQSVDLRSVQVQRNNQQDTPYIEYLCPIHNQNIIYINVTKEAPRESRVACVQCQRTNQIPVAQFAEQWQNYLNEKDEKIKEYQKTMKDILEGCILQLQSITKSQSIRFNDLIHKIQKKNLFGINPSEQNLNPFDNLKNIIQMAKEFSSKGDSFLNEIYKNQQQQLRDVQLDSQFNLEQLVYEQSKDIIKIKEGFRQISYTEIGQGVPQNEQCNAICFNKNGTIMISGCGNNVKIWDFKDGVLQSQITLKGYHQNLVSCLLYSQKSDWFVTGSYDTTLQFWKLINSNKWIVTKPINQHDECISCLIMNQNEDEIISGSWDKSIKIWKVYTDLNTIQYKYSLNEHQGFVLGISLSEGETTLVSCGGDNKIIVWVKIQSVWTFHQALVQGDFGYRISFLGNETIIWQQANKGVTHFFKKINGQFLEQPNLLLELDTFDQDDSFFPTIYNKQQNLIIQKHNRFVFLLKQDFLEKFVLAAQPINCECDFITGGLTQDGQYLVLWNQASTEFKTYKVNYL